MWAKYAARQLRIAEKLMCCRNPLTINSTPLSRVFGTCTLGFNNNHNNNHTNKNFSIASFIHNVNSTHCSGKFAFGTVRYFVSGILLFHALMGGKMVLVNIPTWTYRISLLMHILIVSNDSQLLQDDFRVFQNFWVLLLKPEKPVWDRKYQL